MQSRITLTSTCKGQLYTPHVAGPPRLYSPCGTPPATPWCIKGTPSRRHCRHTGTLSTPLLL